MKRFFLAFPLAVALVTLAACSTDSPVPPAPDNPPALLPAEAYVTNVEVADFNGPKADVVARLQSPDTGVLAFTQANDAIPQITELTVLSGDFPAVGGVRQVKFETGHYAVERSLQNDEDTFQYQVWGFTAPGQRVATQVVGTFAFEALGPDQTRVTWTYQVAPRFGLIRPFVRRFVTRNIVPFMATGLQGAASAYNTK